MKERDSTVPGLQLGAERRRFDLGDGTVERIDCADPIGRVDEVSVKREVTERLQVRRAADGLCTVAADAIYWRQLEQSFGVIDEPLCVDLDELDESTCGLFQEWASRIWVRMSSARSGSVAPMASA